MEEKERRKKLALEQKERKKTEREEKRRQKEEEERRKAEERQKKTEERAKKAKEAAYVKTRRRRETEETTQGLGKSDSAGEAVESGPPRKKLRKLVRTDSEIDTNVCCVCYVLYSEDVTNGSGAEWIECACGHWLHEECAEDCGVDENGKERFCPTCL
jgi:hypothetical protein